MPTIVSVDLGQATDPTAIIVGEQVEDAIHIRHMERPPLHTGYPDICSRIETVVNGLSRWRERRKTSGHVEAYRDVPTLLVDNTGVGRPVVDMLSDVGLKPIAITITGGSEVSGAMSNWNVPKKTLVSSLQIFLQSDRLKIARALPLADVLAQELTNFRAKISTAGNATFEAWREKNHDDLVLSVAQCCWWTLEKAKYTGRQVRLIMG